MPRTPAACIATLILASAAAAQVVNVPPDPFPAQGFFDANPGATVNILAPTNIEGGAYDGTTINYNGAMVNVSDMFFTDLTTVHANASFNISAGGQFGREVNGLRILDSTVNLISGGSIAEARFLGTTTLNIISGGTSEDIDAFDNAVINVLGGALQSDTSSDYHDNAQLIATAGGIFTENLLGFDNATAFIGGSVNMHILTISGFAHLTIAGGNWAASTEAGDFPRFSGPDVVFQGLDFRVNGVSLGLAPGESFTFDGSFYTGSDEVFVDLPNGETLQPVFDTGNFTFTAVPAPATALTLLAPLAFTRRRSA